MAKDMSTLRKKTANMTKETTEMSEKYEKACVDLVARTKELEHERAKTHQRTIYLHVHFKGQMN
jgi:hypothetical protein